jgi:hypothetical protein
MAIAVRQVCFNAGTTGLTVTATFGSATLAGSVIVVAANANGLSTLVLSDSASNAYTDSGLGLVTGSVSQYRIGAFLAPSTGVTTVTATFTGGPSFTEVVAWEVTGMTGPSFDQKIHGSGSSASASSGATGTLASATEIGLAYILATAGVANSGQGASWTDDSPSGGTSNGNDMQHIVVSSTAPITATETVGNATWDAILVTLQSGGAAAKGGTLPLMGVG